LPEQEETQWLLDANVQFLVQEVEQFQDAPEHSQPQLWVQLSPPEQKAEQPLQW